MSAPNTKVKLFDHLDMTRGTTCRQDVYMYCDEPGIYFSRAGYEISNKQAKAVGFDVDTLRKARAKSIKMQQAIRDVEVEFGERTEEIESEYADPAEGKKLDSELVTERFSGNGYPKETANYAMKHMGRTLWTVLDKGDDNRQRIEPCEREDAIDWMITHAEEDARADVQETPAEPADD